MVIKSLSNLPMTLDARARSEEDTLFQRVMAGCTKTRHDLQRDLVEIALCKPEVARLVALSSTFKVLETLLSGSWLYEP